MDDLRELYQEVILDHGRNPRNCRQPDDHSHAAQGDNPMCGDRLTVYLKVDSDGTIQDAAFQGRGCAISIASASIMTEMLPGLKEADAHHLFDCFHQLVTGQEVNGDARSLDKLVVMAGVRNFPVRVKCATLAWHAMTAAMDGRETATTE